MNVWSLVAVSYTVHNDVYFLPISSYVIQNLTCHLFVFLYFYVNYKFKPTMDFSILKYFLRQLNCFVTNVFITVHLSCAIFVKPLSFSYFWEKNMDIGSYLIVSLLHYHPTKFDYRDLPH